jgi:hypothetical protein
MAPGLEHLERQVQGSKAPGLALEALGKGISGKGGDGTWPCDSISLQRRSRYALGWDLKVFSWWCSLSPT